MNFRLTREQFRDDGIFGFIQSESGAIIAVTLEHAFPDHDESSWIPKVPTGVYTCKRRQSAHFGFEVFEILNVHDCTNIEIHPGNWNRDSEGCVLLGDSIGEIGTNQMIVDSKIAFERFMEMQKDVDQFQLEVM